MLRRIKRVQKLVHRMTGARPRPTFANVICESPALKEALRLARLAANSNSTVLLRGETGPGKEIFAISCQSCQPQCFFQGRTLTNHIGKRQSSASAGHTMDQFLHALDAAQDHYKTISIDGF